MRSLLDINVLIALLDSDHPHHVWAVDWFKTNVKQGWASSPLTQNGCVRIMSQAGYPNAIPTAVVIQRLRSATAHGSHEFWPDDVSLVDEAVVDGDLVHGPRQVTDAYLLALSVNHGGRFVTFDESIPVSAVRRAEKKHLLVLDKMASG